jgi:transcriptional regulator with XRE-family HTH domain
MDLATYRKQRGLSQEDLAQHLGLSSKGYISNIEKGERAASLHVALKIEAWSEGAVPAASLSPVAAEIASGATPRKAAA